MNDRTFTSQSPNPNLIDWQLEYQSMKAQLLEGIHVNVHLCAQSWHARYTCFNVYDLRIDVTRHDKVGWCLLASFVKSPSA